MSKKPVLHMNKEYLTLFNELSGNKVNLMKNQIISEFEIPIFGGSSTEPVELR